MTTIWGYYKNGDGVEVARFLDAVDLDTVVDTARAIACDLALGFDDVIVNNDNEGDIWSASAADEYDEPADIDSDVGFDPYEGCCTWDC